MIPNFFERKIENFFPIPIIVIGVVMSLLGIAVFVKHPIFGAINFLIGLVFFLSKKGVQIDYDKNQYREYFGILGFKKGAWKNLPSISLITITPSDKMYVNNAIAGGAQTVSRDTLLKVNLKFNNGRDKIIASSGAKDKVLKDAQILSSIFKINIHDASEDKKSNP